MVPDGQKVWTDGMDGRRHGRTHGRRQHAKKGESVFVFHIVSDVYPDDYILSICIEGTYLHYSAS